MKKYRTMTLLLIACLVLFALVYYVCSRDYLAGEQKHYKGTSTITESEFVEIVLEHSVGYDSPISKRERTDEGILINYDIYSHEDYSFLALEPYNYLGASFFTSNLWVIFAAPFIVILGYYIIGPLNLHIPPQWVDIASRGVEHAFWHSTHPKYIFRKPDEATNYQPNITEEVIIKEVQGYYCARTWKYKHGCLYSSGLGQACWETAVLYADKTPDEKNENGVYAHRLGFIDGDIPTRDIVGIVSMGGQWLEHADGVVRAERCEILHLIINTRIKHHAVALGSRYGVPITIVDDPEIKYLDWIFNDNGIRCMEHNSKIAKGEMKWEHANPL